MAEIWSYSWLSIIRKQGKRRKKKEEEKEKGVKFKAALKKLGGGRVIKSHTSFEETCFGP